MSPARPSERTSGAETARKVLTLLLSFTPARPAWTVAQLAQEHGLSTSSTYRYVGVLREAGLIEAADRGSYHLTHRVMSLAEASAKVHLDIAAIARPQMTALRNAFDETVLISRRDGDYAYTVGRVESRQPVRLQFNPGQAMQLHAGSMPRLLLASMPADERRRYLRGVSPLLTPRQAALCSEVELARVAREGSLESMEEIDAGIWGTAAAISHDDAVVAAIGIAAPIYRTDAERRREIRAAVVGAAAAIGDDLARAAGVRQA